MGYSIGNSFTTIDLISDLLLSNSLFLAISPIIAVRLDAIAYDFAQSSN